MNEPDYTDPYAYFRSQQRVKGELKREPNNSQQPQQKKEEKEQVIEMTRSPALEDVAPLCLTKRNTSRKL